MVTAQITLVCCRVILHNSYMTYQCNPLTLGNIWGYSKNMTSNVPWWGIGFWSNPLKYQILHLIIEDLTSYHSTTLITGYLITCNYAINHPAECSMMGKNYFVKSLSIILSVYLGYFIFLNLLFIVTHTYCHHKILSNHIKQPHQ